MSNEVRRELEQAAQIVLVSSNVLLLLYGKPERREAKKCSSLDLDPRFEQKCYPAQVRYLHLDKISLPR